MAGFPKHDSYWTDVAAFLDRHCDDTTPILAPEEFLERRANIYSYESCAAFADEFFDHLVIHKGMLDRFALAQLDRWVSSYVSVFANEVFVILSRQALKRATYTPDVHYHALLNEIETRRSTGGLPQHRNSEQEVKDFLRSYLRDDEYLLGPKEFLDDFHMTVSYASAYSFPNDFSSIVVFDKQRLDQVTEQKMRYVWGHHLAVFCNDRFIVLSSRAGEQEACSVDPSEWVATGLWDKPACEGDRCAILVTSYSRPWAVERSLPQLVVLGSPVLVVDDGSRPEHLEKIRELCTTLGATLLSIPDNRGLSCALSIGLNYWLADSRVAWISYFQDDVDVHPKVLEVIKAVQDPLERPVLTGRRTSEHPTFGTEVVAGYEIVRYRRKSGVHLHAHRDYWKSVLPIPSPYFRAPKKGLGRPGQGADEDHWITAWAPNSITKRGKYVICIPGLVRTFAHEAEHSTWDQSLHDGKDGPLGQF